MMKKRKFGTGGMPSIEESLKSGNRVSEQVGKETKKLMPPKKRPGMPSPGESVKSGNRMAGENAKDLKAVKKYAAGGNVAAFNPTQALNSFSADLARRVQAGTMTKQQAQQAQSQFRNQVQLNTAAPPTRQGAEGIARNIMLQSQQAAKALQDFQSDRSAGGGNSFGQLSRGILGTQPGMTPTPAQTPIIGSTLGGIGAPKTGFQNPPSMQQPAKGPATPRIGYGTTDPRMKKGGKVAKPPVKKMAKGGSVSSRADGCAVRGKTKGKMV